MPAYAISYLQDARTDLRALDRRDASAVADSVVHHLADQPVPVEGREGQRRVMDPNPLGAQYRLRVGDYRCYYKVDEANATVVILRVGRKVRERVYLRGVRTEMRD